jgi:hypothetical protein
MLWKRQEYETIPEFEIEQIEKEQWSNEEPLARFYGRKHLRIIIASALVICGVVGLVNRSTIATLSDQISKMTTFKAAPPLHQTMPTLLSVVNATSGNYLLALSNPLYKKMQQASFTFDENPGSLNLDKQRIDTVDTPLTLSWSDLATKIPIQDNDVIALFCGDRGFSKETLEPTFFLEAATIAQIRATNQKHGGATTGVVSSWYIPKFPILRQEACMFTLFQATDDENTYKHVASSDELTFYSTFTPTGIHLSYGDDVSSMVIIFNTDESSSHHGVPIVMFGQKDGPLDTIIDGTSDTYRAEDMCHAPANTSGAGKFYPPGLIHTITIKDLEPNTQYAYKVGYKTGHSVTWSDIFYFTSAPKIGDDGPFSLIVYGDQGCPDSGWVDGEEWIKGLALREESSQNPTPVRAVLHYGDLAYADGAAHIWSAWLQMIQPFMATTPLMIGVGNHEYDYVSPLLFTSMFRYVKND